MFYLYMKSTYRHNA